MSANPTPDQIRSLLREVKTIAVVGLSPRAERPSDRVSRAMQGFGYRIVPVRPAVTEVLGEKAYARLSDIPFPVDLVDVFRNADEKARAKVLRRLRGDGQSVSFFRPHMSERAIRSEPRAIACNCARFSFFRWRPSPRSGRRRT